MDQSPFPRERVGKALHKAGLSEMPYGYLIRNPASAAASGRVYELAMAGAGIAVSIAVVGVVLVPALMSMQGVAELQIATSITLLSLATLLLRNASRGNLVDSEIDFLKEEVRLVRRNARGHARIETRVPFDQISSMFVHRSKARASSSNTLYLRVAGTDIEFPLVRGAEEAMSTLHRRLVRDINTVVLSGKAVRFAGGERSMEVAHAAEAVTSGMSTA